MLPSRIWFWSSRLWHARGSRPKVALFRGVARILKGVNLLMFRCILPPEAELARPVTFVHYALGVVIHPNTTFQGECRIFHNVTISAATKPGSPYRVTIGAGCMLGAGCILIPKRDTGMTIGDGAAVAAGAIVTKDVPAGLVARSRPAEVTLASDAVDPVGRDSPSGSSC